MANLTKAQRSAAGKKAARTRKRNSGAVSTSVTKRKKRTTVKTSFLSEMFNPKLTQAGVKSMVSGAVGGMGAVTLMKLTPGQTPTTQALILGASAFVASTMLKMPNVGAGISAVAVFKLMENAGMLNEGNDMALANYAEPIEQLPMVLDEQGNEMYLDENDNFDLSEYEVGYYTPGFGGEGYAMS